MGLGGDVLSECLRWFGVEEVLAVRLVCRLWDSCVVSSRRHEVGWRLPYDVTLECHDGVVPLHLFTSRGETQAQLVIEKGSGVGCTVGVPPAMLNVHTDAYWWCVAGRRLFEIILQTAAPPSLVTRRIPKEAVFAESEVLVEDLNSLFPDVLEKLLDFSTMLPFIIYHKFQHKTLLKIGDMIQICDEQSSFHPHKRSKLEQTDRITYSEEEMLKWNGLETSYYVCTKDAVILMSGFKSFCILLSQPNRLNVLPYLQYSVSPLGETVVSTKNSAKESYMSRHSPHALLEEERVVSWTTEDLNKIVLGRATRIRLFLMDCVATDDDTAMCLVCPAGMLPPVAVFVVSLLDSTLLCCVNLAKMCPRVLQRGKHYSPFNFSVDVARPPTYAIKATKSVKPPSKNETSCISVLLPLDAGVEEDDTEGKGMDYIVLHLRQR